MTLEQLWERILSSKTQTKREYWLSRYGDELRRQDPTLIRKVKGKTRPIDEILNDRKGVK